MGLLDEENDNVKNPAAFTLEWAGDGMEGGYAKRYDPETKTTENMGLYKPFIPIVSTSSISGYKAIGIGSGISYWSNEVMRTGSDTITVWQKKTGDKKATVLVAGLYQDIKEVCNSNGAGYVKSIYCHDGDSIFRLKLKGGSLMEFGKVEETIPRGRVNTGQGMAFTGFEQKKNGGVHYRSPTFGTAEFDPEKAAEILEEAKQKVGPYIDYLRKKAMEQPEPVTDPQTHKRPLYPDPPGPYEGIEEDVPF